MSILTKQAGLIGTFLTRRPPVNAHFSVFLLMSAIVATTLAYWKNLWGLAQYLPANKQAIFVEGQWWRLLSAVLIHGDMEHLLSNAFMLIILGFLVSGYYGAKLLLLGSLVGGVLINLISVWTYSPMVNLLGISGVVYGLGAFWLTLYFCLQRQYGVGVRLLRIIGISLVIFFPTSFDPSVSYRTHGVGFLVGALLGAIYFIKNKTILRSYEVYKVEPDEALEQALFERENQP